MIFLLLGLGASLYYIAWQIRLAQKEMKRERPRLYVDENGELVELEWNKKVRATV